MNRHGAIELDFGDGTYTFRLGMGEIRELEEKAGKGVFLIAHDLDPDNRAARFHVILETLRLGLIGGGMVPIDALALCRRYVEERPAVENLMTAYAVVVAALARVKSDELPKDDAPSGEPEASETGEPTSAPSTQPAQS